MNEDEMNKLGFKKSFGNFIADPEFPLYEKLGNCHKLRDFRNKNRFHILFQC